MPLKVLAVDKFEAGVAELRKRFTEKDRDDFLFKPVYHKRIPADGVAHYMEGIWVIIKKWAVYVLTNDNMQEQVQTNKDLDLPTQQELLAQFRCDEIANAALEQFSAHARSQKRPVEAGKVIEGLGGMMRSWKDEALGKLLILLIFRN